MAQQQIQRAKSIMTQDLRAAQIEETILRHALDMINVSDILSLVCGWNSFDGLERTQSSAAAGVSSRRPDCRALIQIILALSL